MVTDLKISLVAFFQSGRFLKRFLILEREIYLSFHTFYRGKIMLSSVNVLTVQNYEENCIVTIPSKTSTQYPKNFCRIVLSSWI